MIQFAYSAFLIGTGLVLVPIILHLLKNKPSVPEFFPSLQFILATVAKHRKKNTIFKWLILCLRIAIISLICLAFAWPFIANMAPEIRSARVLLWDQSFSMQARPWNNELQDKARKIINKSNFSNPLLIGAVSENVKWSGNFNGNNDRLLDWFKKNKKSSASSSLPIAIKYAEEKLKSINCKNKKIIIITDNQLVPWDRMDYNQFLDDGIKLELIRPLEKKSDNGVVTSIKNRSIYTEINQPLKIFTQVHNYSNNELIGQVKVEIPNYIPIVRNIKIPSHKNININITLKPMAKNKVVKAPLKPLPCTVILKCDDDIKIDNIHYFWIKPVTMEKVKVAKTIFNKPNFILTALMPKVDQAKIKNIFYSGSKDEKLNGTNLVFLQNLKLLDNNYQRQINQFIENGGWVFLVAKNDSYTKSFMKQFNVSIKKQCSNITKFTFIDYEHDVFSPYNQVKSESWYNITFSKWFQLDIPESATVLASFSEGFPAIIELNHKRGKIFILASELSRKSTDLATSSVFLPFLRELLNISKNVNVANGEPDSIDANSNPLIVGEKDLIYNSNDELLNSKREKFIPNTPGCYWIDSEQNGISFFSINTSVKESNNTVVPNSVNEKILKIAKKGNLTPKKVLISKGEKFASMQDSKSNSWWQILLVIALVFMLFEIIIANRVAI